MWRILCGILSVPQNTVRDLNNVMTCIEAFLAKIVKLFPSLGEDTRSPPPQGFSEIRMWFVLEATMH